MVFGDAESIARVKKYFDHNKHSTAKMTTNPNKNIKNMQNSLSTDLQSLMLI